MEPCLIDPASSYCNHRFPELWQGIDIPTQAAAGDQLAVTDNVPPPTSSMSDIASSRRWQMFEGEGVLESAHGGAVEQDFIITNCDPGRTARFKQTAVEFLNSIIGVALVAAIVVGIALIMIRPAFILRKDDKRRICFSRLVIWMLIVLAIVGLRDQILGFNENVIMPMKCSVTSAWEYVMPPRT